MKLIVNHNTNNVLKTNDEQLISLQQFVGIEDVSLYVSINLLDCLDFVPLEKRDKLLRFAIQKLRLGGTLTVSGVDLRSIASYIISQTMSFKQVQTMLYGDGRQSAESMWTLLNTFEDIGLEPISSKISNGTFCIEARRPNA